MRVGFGEELVAVVHELLKQGGNRERREVAPENDIVASLVQIAWLKLETERQRLFVAHGIRTSRDIPVSDCATDNIDLLRRHELFRAVVVLAVDGDSRRVPLGNYREAIPK